ncbi:hypothetical protein BDQ12DRAFT_674232 [Crucibulum laeve]|uniref:F-box domain-containing protein n=1 Tax=Crucibulum laeve TaxID=68775 RepID=A0A5C3MI97_9AGAR|nr:hypothetical protein BDQ12DRAFT_674232 [Crucibulum laeve]
MGLSTLPYDLLLNIAAYLDLQDVHTLHLTCKALHDFSTTRPVYRKLANDLLRRCRALPLKGFQRLSDLTTEQLIRSVNKATRYEVAWRVRGPHPIAVNEHSNYMDLAGTGSVPKQDRWYKIVSAPPGEEVDWLSPITSSYTLCATKSGKVVCWDVQSDRCLAEWNPGEKWELWKCRVEFEERTVYFTMAKVLAGSFDDARVMEFVLMRLTFSDGPSGESSAEPPVFSHVTEFRTTGVVMNVFLLDPAVRLLSAFVWVSGSNTIGLYALPDWNEPEYVFIDTGIECVMSSNWSCILYDDNIVIHCEESEAAFQHFYPISLLRTYSKTLMDRNSTPTISQRVTPWRSLSKKFIFPRISEAEVELDFPDTDGDADAMNEATPTPFSAHTTNSTSTSIPIHTGPTTNGHIVPAIASTPTPAAAAVPNPNPFPFPPWYPESAHFVRQWWPSLPGIPKVSCTVILLAVHDQVTHRTRFVLAQHYFRVPINYSQWLQGGIQPPTNRVPKVLNGNQAGGSASSSSLSGSSSSSAASSSTSLSNVPLRPSPPVPLLLQEEDDSLMHLWYVSTPFEVVRVFDSSDDEEDENTADRPRPLVAVDFGHAVWIEYMDVDEDRVRPDGIDSESDPKWLRFVTFPSFSDDEAEDGSGGPALRPGSLEGHVRTLEVPDELDLGTVETINIDQSQGAVILSDREGKIFILCYE